ncbi:putative methyl-CpG-binding domain protein 3-like 3 [Cavia porcellus]|uniref:putative methyl-CpG-binding domain protein 3-like 3 n=1 Tax=Cavia porcellus TaxID=10141 RepID=UPI002FDFCBCF
MGHFVASLSLSASQERIQQCGNSDHGGSSNTSGAKPAFRGKSQKHATPNFQREPYVWASKAKHRAAVPFAPPEKLTSCVFPRPMTLITTHPGNEVRDGPCKVKLEKSQQLCASWRRIPGPVWCQELAAYSWHIAVVERDDLRSFLSFTSLLSQWVTAADIQRQTRKLKKARERLAKALKADRLAGRQRGGHLGEKS